MLGGDAIEDQSEQAGLSFGLGSTSPPCNDRKGYLLILTLSVVFIL